MSAATLEARLALLEARQAIADLKACYAQLADAKYTSAYQRVPPDEWRSLARQQAACFTEDAAWDGGPEFGGALIGREALAAWFARSPWRFALHYYVAPDLAFETPEKGAGTWRLWQLALPLDGAHPILLAGTTRESYRLTPGGWLIASMRFEEIHTVDLGQMPAALRCVLPRRDA